MPLFRSLAIFADLCYRDREEISFPEAAMHFVTAKGILSAHNGMNIYRGCLHGCIYCDARSTCYQMNHAFEDIEVKLNAPELLEDALKRKRKKCMIGTGAMSDPYLPLEKDLGLTRKCLEIIHRYGFGLAIQTKSDLIMRDLPLLKSINERAKCVVQLTLTTFDESLCRILEPNVCTTARRFEVLRACQEAGIPTVVWLTPILPFINDTEENLSGLLSLCREAKVRGVITFGLGLTLRDGDRQYFYRQLDRHFPGLKEKYIQTYGNAYELPIPREKELMALLRKTCEEAGIEWRTEKVFEFMNAFDSPAAGEQVSFLNG